MGDGQTGDRHGLWVPSENLASTFPSSFDQSGLIIALGPSSKKRCFYKKFRGQWSMGEMGRNFPCKIPKKSRDRKRTFNHFQGGKTIDSRELFFLHLPIPLSNNCWHISSNSRHQYQSLTLQFCAPIIRYFSLLRDFFSPQFTTSFENQMLVQRLNLCGFPFCTRLGG